MSDLTGKRFTFSLGKLITWLFIFSCLLLGACQEFVPINTALVKITEGAQATSEPTKKSSDSTPAANTRESFQLATRTPTRDPELSPSVTDRQRSTPTTTPDIIYTPTNEPLPTSELLYRLGSDLIIWNYQTNKSQIIAKNIADFAVAESGRYIALLESTNITANGVELFHLVVLDLSTDQETLVLENTPRLKNIGISPNGDWVNYEKGQGRGELFVIRKDDPEQIHNLGECKPESGEECLPPIWSPDGQSLLWIDTIGIWSMSTWDMNTRLIHPARITIKDPKGNEQEIQVRFDYPKWSPAGRYALLEIIPSNEGVHWQGLLDVRNGRLVEVPDSFQYIKSGACASWTKDGKILVGHSGDSQTQSSPQIKQWEIVPTNEDLLVLGSNFVITSDLLPGLPENTNITAQYFPDWLEQIQEGSTYFGLSILDNSTTPMLLKLDLSNGKLEEIIAIPYASEKVNWSPDGAAALVLGAEGEIIFAPFDGSLMQDLHELLGENISDLTWLPPNLKTSS